VTTAGRNAALPQVGGRPYTHYRAHLEVDARVCTVTGHRG